MRTLTNLTGMMIACAMTICLAHAMVPGIMRNISDILSHAK